LKNINSNSTNSTGNQMAIYIMFSLRLTYLARTFI